MTMTESGHSTRLGRMARVERPMISRPRPAEAEKGNRSFDLLQVSPYRTLGDLPEPKFAHKFC